MNWKNFLSLGEVFTYFFRKSDPNRPVNTSLKMMHGVNKLSILMFLLCLAVMIYRYATR
jgi:hypothetical protein